MGYINVTILAAILYYSFTSSYHWGKLGQRVCGILLYCFLQLHMKSTIITTKNSIKNKPASNTDSSFCLLINTLPRTHTLKSLFTLFHVQCFASKYVCVPRVCFGACKDPKRALDFMELKSQVVENQHVIVGNCLCMNNKCYLLTTC